ncbi:hypothetical protein ACWEQ7_24005 [Streptomyces sp. NPDC004069]
MSQHEIAFPQTAENWLTIDNAPGIATDSVEERAWVPAYGATPAKA